LIKHQSANLINRIDEIEQIADKLTSRSKIKILYMVANKLFDSIVQARRDGLNERGETSPDNITFKVLRRTGHLGKLKNIKNYLFNILSSK
jgi:hypothetical protein